MAGNVQATIGVALLRAVLGAALTCGSVYFTTINTVDDDCGATTPPATEDCETGDRSAEDKALAPALAAAFAYLLARGGFEGTRDALRQKSDDVKPSDVQV